jgi:5-formyltetrahydrofolate cyclo-ligase
LGADLAGHLLRELPPPPRAVVAGFWPLAGEIDLRPLLHTLAGRGHRIALPVTPRPGNPLSFRLWRPGDELVRERFGTMRPVGEPVVPDYLLVPLLAFDRRGYRLGYGGGFYDRTLAGLPAATAIGCGFAAQELDEVPVGPYDIRLTAIATERGLIFT